MYQTIYAQDFRDAFKEMGRADHFTHEALNMLFDHFEEWEPDAELDVIAICCAYAEDMPASIAEDYSIDTEDMDEGEALDAVLEYLGEKTQVIGVTDAGAIVYSSEF